MKLTWLVIRTAVFLGSVVGSLCAQPALLVGRITDAAKEGQGIAGADVKVDTHDGRTLTALSGADGTYLIAELSRGSVVSVSCAKLGYMPNPKSRRVALNADQNRWDVSLIHNTVDRLYWEAYARTKARRLGSNEFSGAAQNTTLVSEWIDLELAGLSPEALAQAARALLEVKPPKVRTPFPMALYSAAELQRITEARKDIGSALESGAAVNLRSYGLPMRVAVNLCADVITQKRPAGTATEESLANVIRGCGADCGAQVRQKLESRAP